MKPRQIRTAHFPSKNKMREIEIRNPWELAILSPRIYIDFHPHENGRLTRCARYQVVHCGNKTDPKSHWQDYGHKTFSVFGSMDKEQRARDAIKWATEYSGITEWVRDPWGGFQDARLVAIVKEKLKAVKK